MLAMVVLTPLASRRPASSLATIASMLAPTGGCGRLVYPSIWLSTARSLPGFTGLFSSGASSLCSERRH